MSVDWTEDELRAAVEAYLEMAERDRRGEPLVKAPVYRELAGKFGRTRKAFEYRMQNISYVLTLMGRGWLPGLVPAKNVGMKVAAQIERLITELEGRPSAPRAAEAIEVRERLKRLPTAPPKGTAKPKASVTSVTIFARDPDVKAWVLARAAGKCEACSGPAPFVTADDLPFLEVHHVRQLADQGADLVTNAVALCPNCHRRLHYGKDAHEYREKLFQLVPELTRE
ncbi:HNH endonuclease [Variovorax sp. SRS16]|uniref:HNH endonuclease n=1 Tax=Variovorax sp. SRS16 TaxID=282217 RepID=UPI001316D16F|nr:HNH endonuclease signature motif containing protein [Variovorax sp. SRS16]VTU25029.1 HNH endonuclease [Variovorax sp. SRS16]